VLQEVSAAQRVTGAPGEAQRLKDKFGLSWQIVPTALFKLIQDPDPEKSKRAMEALLQMKKIYIERLEHAYSNP
jgi:predicted 3-demethylubiquinone-9 3-methyltransferase (glyoxalase superfamily)